MPVCAKTKLRNTAHRFVAMFFVAFALCASAAVHAAGFFVLSAKSDIVENVYRLTANIEYQLSSDVESALRNGIPVVVQLDIEVLRPRAYYLWSETVATLRQQYRLQYYALSQRYIVTNLNSDFRDHFDTLQQAIASLGNVVDLPILDKSLLESGEKYAARMRAGLDLGALPVPLRYYAYVLPAWRLDSEWYNFPL